MQKSKQNFSRKKKLNFLIHQLLNVPDPYRATCTYFLCVYLFTICIFFIEFATLIKAEVGSSSPIEHREAVEDDPKRRRPDISLAKKVLDWEPKVTLKAGLSKTIDYFRKELSRKHYSDGNGVHPQEYQVTKNDII